MKKLITLIVFLTIPHTFAVPSLGTTSTSKMRTYQNLMGLKNAAESAVYWCVTLEANPIRYHALRTSNTEDEVQRACSRAMQIVDSY